MKLLKKYYSLPIQVKASFWFFLCSIIQKSISVVSTAVFTRIISTTDYGLISIYNSWSDILVMIASVNLSVGCFNVGMTKFNKDRVSWVTSLQALSLITSIIFTIVFFLSFPITKQWLDIPYSCLFAMVSTFFSIPALNLWMSKQRYNCSYRSMVLVSLIYSLGAFLVSLLFILSVTSNKGVAKIIGTAVITGIIGFILLINNLNLKSIKVNKYYMQFAFKYNFQMMPAFLSSIVLNQIDRVMIDVMVGRKEAGIYSVSYNAAYVISVVSNAISATYNPWMMNKAKKQDYSGMDKIGTTITECLLLVILGFIFCAPEFVKIIASSEYRDAVYIIPAVAGSTFFNLIYTLYCPIPQYEMKAKQLSLLTVLASILNVALNYIAINKWGYIAAGYTTYICFMIYGWGTGIYSILLLKKKGINSDIYNLKKLIGYTLALSIAVIITPFLYNGYIIRYTILLLVIVFFMINLKDKVHTFTELKEQ